MLKAIRKIRRWINARFYGSRRPWRGLGAPEKIFSYIYEHNSWGDGESVSGAGSNLQETAVLREQLPLLLGELGVHDMLDIPCGDFHWLSRVDLKIRRYIGADIVLPLILTNGERHGRNDENRSIAFEQMNILEGPLPRVDLILCRDCLVHFSNADVWRALAQIKRSGSKYLLTTTFPAHAYRKDIKTGEWRALNLSAPPFNFPSSIKMLEEHSSLRRERYADKSLGLWQVADLPRGCV